MEAFKSIIEFQKHFDTEEKCRLFLEEQRWGSEPCCIFCGSIKVKRIKDGKRFQCNEKECRKQFSVTVGTVCENTKIPLTKWFLAMYILANHSKGISSLQLASRLNLPHKIAIFLNHKIRKMLTDKAPNLLSAIVEVDGKCMANKTPKDKVKNLLLNRKEGFYYVHGEGENRKVVIDMPDNSIK